MASDWKYHVASVAEYLLAHGHIQALHYTLRQAITFYHFASHRDGVEASHRMNEQRIAYHADEKTFDKALKSFK